MLFPWPTWGWDGSNWPCQIGAWFCPPKNISPHQNLFFGVKIVTVWWNIAGCMSWYTRDIDNVMFWFLKIPTLNLRGWKSDQTFTLQIYIRFLKHETRKTHRIIKDHIKQNVCLAFESLKKKDLRLHLEEGANRWLKKMNLSFSHRKLQKIKPPTRNIPSFPSPVRLFKRTPPATSLQSLGGRFRWMTQICTYVCWYMNVCIYMANICIYSWAHARI